jgi:arylsulfatase A-like enzyme
MRYVIAVLMMGVWIGAPAVAVDRPNVLFIAIDDLNDWIEPLGGHPQAKTPNLSRFAKQAVNFTRNYCPSPGCNPSRSAVMTGYLPYKSGMYSNYQDWRKVMPGAVTLGEYFRQNGYYSAGAGKIYHYSQVAPRTWDAYYPSQENNMPQEFYPKPGRTVNMPEFHHMYTMFDWSPIPLRDEETSDFQSVDYVSKQLGRDHDKPFFLACGIYRPHLPWYVPQKYFDQHPLDEVELPTLLKGDQDDLPPRALDIAARGGNYHKHVTAAAQWREAVQGYLASISFADAMLGRLLDALEASDYADNTIVVVWSDHGWQLGQKQHWRKFALWENVARCVLMVRTPEARESLSALPGGIRAGERSERVTSLIDIYPTLVELCGLPPRPDLHGRSLVPLLRDPKKDWPYPAITTYDINEFSIRTERYRYIQYIDGSEELYDHENDPNEWRNLAETPEFQSAKRRMRGLVPENPAPLLKETLIELQPHHFPPYLSVEDYERRNR